MSADSPADPRQAALEQRLAEARRRMVAAQAEGGFARPAGDYGPLESGPPVLSFAQERLWFACHMNPESPVYNRPLALRVRGPLQVERLELALGDLLHRHTVLRTVYPELDGAPAIRVLDPVPVDLPVEDLSHLPPETQPGEVLDRMRRQTAIPFDLATGPLVRARLYRLSDEFVLLLVIHHLNFDAWSANVLQAELEALYHGGAVLPEPVQYADFAGWQRRTLDEQALAPLLQTWLRRLQGPSPGLEPGRPGEGQAGPPSLEPPADRPRPPVHPDRGAVVAFTIPLALTVALDGRSSVFGVTRFMLLLTAFQALIARYTGQTDFIIGSPVAGRTRLEVENTIGFFVNMLALRADLSGSPTFAEALERTRVVTQDAFANQELPFERLVESLELPPDPSRPPLFQVVFNLKNLPPVHRPLLLADRNVIFTPWVFDDGLTPYDLTLEIVPAGDHLDCRLIYATALFDAWRIERLAGHFLEILKGVAANPDQLIAELPLLTDPERRQILEEWNFARLAAVPVTPQDRLPVPELIAGQVRLQPDAVALVQGGKRIPRRSWTYAELDRAANRVARYLVDAGIGLEDRVGVCMSRSPEQVAALLGVLKTGAAYIPLDPAYPDERMAYKIRDAGLRLVLTDTALLDRLSKHGVRLACLDCDEYLETLPDAPVDRPLTPDTAAYIIYTSGSKGFPKGVVVEHGGLSNLVAWHRRAFAVTADDQVTHLAGQAFDAAAWEIWPHLASGAAIHLLEDTADLDPERLVNWLVESGITISFLPTPLAEQVLKLPWPENTRLRVMLTGGDRLKTYPPPGLPFALVNNYGPTETTIVATSGVIYPDEVGSVPPDIGAPIDGLTSYIIDEDGNLLPVGVTGELCIGGAGVSRGYLNQPELTAQRYCFDPFSRRPGARMYCTGDRVRWKLDGRIEFMGRSDDQVKLRGLRIELGEIDAALSAHPGVNQSAVLLRSDPGFGDRLVAYWVPDTPSSFPSPGTADDGKFFPASELADRPGLSGFSDDDLRQWLAQRLPEYMVPSAFVRMEVLPLTPNGKVDRRVLAALPAPASSIREHRSPRTNLERLLAGIWSEILNAPQVGLESSFFELGGHSLLTIRLIAEINDLLGTELPVRLAFEAPRLEVFAVEVQRRAGNPDGLEKLAAMLLELAAMPEEEAERRLADKAFPLSSVQQGMLYAHLADPQAGRYIVQWWIDVPEALDQAALEAAWNELFERHSILRTSFHWQGLSQPEQRVEPHVNVALLEHDWRDRSPNEQEADFQAFLQAEYRQGLNLVEAPCFRLALFRLGHDCWRMLRTSHHMTHDGRSSTMLYRELFERYDAIRAGEHLPVTPAPPFQMHVEWLAHRQANPSPEEIAYWQDRLRGIDGPTPLPGAYPEADLPTPGGTAARASLRLSVDRSERLYAFAREIGVTPGTLVHAAWGLLLGRSLDRPAVLFGAPRACRKGYPEAGQILGPLVSTLPLRIDLPSAGEPTVDWLRRLRREWQALAPYEAASLFAIQQWTGYPRGLPLFDSVVNFDYHSFPQAIRQAGERLERLRFNYRQGADLPLALNAFAEAEMLLEIVLDKRRFPPGYEQALLDEFVTLLEGLLERK